MEGISPSGSGTNSGMRNSNTDPATLSPHAEHSPWGRAVHQVSFYLILPSQKIDAHPCVGASLLWAVVNFLQRHPEGEEGDRIGTTARGEQYGRNNGKHGRKLRSERVVSRASKGQMPL